MTIALCRQGVLANQGLLARRDCLQDAQPAALHVAVYDAHEYVQGTVSPIINNGWQFVFIRDCLLEV